MTTTAAQALLTDFDQLDIADALRNAAAYNATSLDARDRQALALLTYAPDLPGATRTLLAGLADGTINLPLPTASATHLLDVIGDDDLLGPEPEWPVQEAWLAARESAASASTTASVRARLDQLMAATRDLTDSAHRPLTHTLNTLNGIADSLPGLDITDWSQAWLRATGDLERMEGDRLAGRHCGQWGRQLKGALATLAAIIYRALGDDQPEPSTVVATVPARNGLLGYEVHAIRKGAPLPAGQHIADVKDYGSDTHLIVIDDSGREHYMHRHTRIRLLDSGVVSVVAPEYAGWASD